MTALGNTAGAPGFILRQARGDRGSFSILNRTATNQYSNINSVGGGIIGGSKGFNSGHDRITGIGNSQVNQEVNIEVHR